MLVSLLALASLSVFLASALDTSSHCGQWDSIDTGIQYSILLDQWGASGASSGVSCASLTSVSGSSVAWVNNWTWTGGTGVKSFTDVQLNDGVNQQLSAIGSMPVRIFHSLRSSAIDVCGSKLNWFHRLDDLDLEPNHHRNNRRRCSLRYVHLHHIWRLRRQRNHDLDG